MLICCVQHVRLPGDVAGEMRQFARAVYAALIKAEGTMRKCGEEWWGTEFRIHSMQSHAGSALLTSPAQRWQVDTVAPGLEKVKTGWVLMACIKCTARTGLGHRPNGRLAIVHCGIIKMLE
jgi:hypothetical protein